MDPLTTLLAASAGAALLFLVSGYLLGSSRGRRRGAARAAAGAALGAETSADQARPSAITSELVDVTSVAVNDTLANMTSQRSARSALLFDDEGLLLDVAGPAGLEAAARDELGAVVAALSRTARATLGEQVLSVTMGDASDCIRCRSFTVGGRALHLVTTGEHVEASSTDEALSRALPQHVAGLVWGAAPR